MSSPSTRFAAAQHHQAGNLVEAERLYRQVLEEQPDHADTLHLLGITLSQTDRHVAAIESLCRAVALNPGNAAFQNNLGEAYSRGDEFPNAVDCYRVALQLQPNFFQASFHPANAFKRLGDVDGASNRYGKRCR